MKKIQVAKKAIVVTGLTLLTVLLSGCATNKDVEELKNQITDQQEQLKTVAWERDRFKQENRTLQEQIQKNQLEANVGQDTLSGDVILQSIRIVTNDIYKSGEFAGAIYGPFNVDVSVKNNGPKDLTELRIVGEVQKTITHYQSPPNVEIKNVVIPQLKAGQSTTVTLRDFRPEHPETLQELIVSVAGYDVLQKKRLRMAFPPGSQD